MGCFLACFSASKHRKPKHLLNNACHTDEGSEEVLQLHVTTKQQVTEEQPIMPIAESKDKKQLEESKDKKLEEQLSCNGKRKVTFDLNVKTYDGLSTDVVENNGKKDSENKGEEPSNGSLSTLNLISSDGAPYLPNYRYQNCIKEDFEDSDLDNSKEILGCDGQILVQEESSESLFSLSIDLRKHVFGAEVDEKEVSSSMPKCSSPPHGELNAGHMSYCVDSELDSIELKASESLFSFSIDSCKQMCGDEVGEREVSSPMPKYGSPHERLKAMESNSNARDKSHFADSVLESVEFNTSESLFSLSIDSSKQMCGAEVGEMEVSSPMPKCGSSHEELEAIDYNRIAQDRNQSLNSIVNPVENVTHWKEVKARATSQSQYQDKENIKEERDFGVGHGPEPSFKLLTKNAKANAGQKDILNQEILVDTSLSSWLTATETTPLSKCSVNTAGNSSSGKESSPRRQMGRQIFGELTLNQLEKNSASTSFPRSRSQSPDEEPIVGTVGSYWRLTGRTINSDSNSSYNETLNTISNRGKVEWNSTPFEVMIHG